MSPLVRSFLIMVVLVVPAGSAVAQNASAQGAGAIIKGEAEVLVPPQGTAVEVPIHLGTNVILSFPEKLAADALYSSTDWDIQPWGKPPEGVAVRAAIRNAKPATLALATFSGKIKVNVTFRVVPDSAAALTLVRFKTASAEDAFKAAVAAEVAAEVAKQTVALRDELAQTRKALDAKVRDRVDASVARRILTRLEQVRLAAHERNDDNVIVHVQRGIFLGEDGYLVFEIENRSGAAYRLAQVHVVGPTGSDHAGPASLLTSAMDQPEAGIIGVVAAGGHARGVVTLRNVDAVLGRSLQLVVEEPEGRGRIVVDRGIVLR